LIEILLGGSKGPNWTRRAAVCCPIRQTFAAAPRRPAQRETLRPMPGTPADRSQSCSTPPPRPRSTHAGRLLYRVRRSKRCPLCSSRPFGRLTHNRRLGAPLAACHGGRGRWVDWTALACGGAGAVLRRSQPSRL